ncbi:MAG TPA: tail fiber domain-containing protein [Blastocatellia bacterium]|nr:tail fiber domain-containing protein [Blastocatellia bacterium]
MSKRMLVLPQLWAYVFLVSVILLPAPNAAGTALAQGTAFTYQGKLTDSGNPATGQYDFQLKLFDTATVGTGTQQGPTVTVSNVTVTAGIFTVQLDFGVCASCFDGSARFLEIAVKQTSGSTFMTLGPRQPVTANPYAIRSMNAAVADGLSVACVNCVTTSQIQNIQGSQVTGNISGSQISGTIPVASVPAGSANYIQNQNSSLQASANFDVSNGTVEGTLIAGLVKANQYNIGAFRVLSNPGLNNLFAGVGAGASNTIGDDNAFFGWNAGNANNANFNAFFGPDAGRVINGNANSFFGEGTGFNITTGSDNAFFGASAGGGGALGMTNSGNTLLGSHAESVDGTTNAAAIGFQALVTTSNSLVLGSISGTNNATASTNVGIGTTAPLSRLDIVDPTGTQIRFGDTTTDTGGYLVSTTSTQAILSGGAKFDGTNWIAKSTAASRIDNLSGTTRFFTDTGLTAGSAFSPTERMRITATGQVGIGTNAPSDKLHVAGDIRVGTGTTGCVKDADGTVIAGACSSDVRLKRSITPFPELLEKLVRLQPVHFYWRADQFPERHLGSSQSFGLVAQDVEKVMPDLVAEDESGYKVVRYNKLPLILLEALKELKAENDSLKQELHKVSQQQEQSRRQQIVIDGLKKMICLDHPNADLCK